MLHRSKKTGKFSEGQNSAKSAVVYTPRITERPKAAKYEKIITTCRIYFKKYYILWVLTQFNYLL